MPTSEAASKEQQNRISIRLALARAGIHVDDERLAALARAVEANRVTGEAISRAVSGDRPPAVFRAPGPRDDA